MSDQAQVTSRKFCNGCGALAPAEETACPRCGADLPLETVEASTEAPLAEGTVHRDPNVPILTDEVPPPPVRWGRMLLIALALTAIAGATIATVAVLHKTSPDERYLEQLDAAGQRGVFKSDQDAVNHAHDVCTFFENGGARRGTTADKIAVQNYCHGQLEGFQLAVPQTIQGTVVLEDAARFGGAEREASCRGGGSWADLVEGGHLSVRSAHGGLLGTAPLGVGVQSTTTCSLAFQIDLSPGQTTYLLSVGRHPAKAFRWADLVNGVTLRYSAGS